MRKPKKYATECDLPRPKYVAVEPRYATFCTELYTVNIRYMTCRICDSMDMSFFCRETVVLQVSSLNRSQRAELNNQFGRQFDILALVKTEIALVTLEHIFNSTLKDKNL
jgi:hypothetical protein